MRATMVDAVVVGGGPAGAATAIRLAQAGLTVQLHERSTYDRPRMGETLPPEVTPLLRDLGVWQRFDALNSLPSYQTASAWGQSEIAERSFIFSPHGTGWHTDRRAFDAMLSAAAADSGATVVRGSGITAVRRVGDVFHVEAASPVQARWVVDATGRGARIARRLGAQRHQLDRLVSAARTFTLSPAQPVGDTLLESTATGWWYVSPLPESRRLIAFFTDAGYASSARLSTVRGWDMALTATRHVAAYASGEPNDSVLTVSAASHYLEPCTGPGWIAVGDAALAVDPLSSGGVAFALRSAARAAGIVTGADPTVYRHEVSVAGARYRQLRRDVYSWEPRFADTTFWRQRIEANAVSGSASLAGIRDADAISLTSRGSTPT